MTFLTQAISRWTSRADDPLGDEIWRLYMLLQFLETQLFFQYEPTVEPGTEDFSQRLDRWLATPDDDNDRRTLFRLLRHLYFIGRQEFEVLYTSAFNDIVLHWLIRTHNVKLDHDLGDRLDEQLARTWFCPITDSMEIARFCHLNGIASSPGYRPDWRSLVKFGDPHRVIAYCQEQELSQVVLLEDFVGTGTQASDAAELACTIAAAVPLRALICPLIITTDGLKCIEAAVGKSEAVEVWPRQILDESVHIRPSPPSGETEPTEQPRFRELLRSLHPQVADGASISPFGWGDLGTMGVMFTNCPNNAPLVLHHGSGRWTPLFPRSTRSN